MPIRRKRASRPRRNNRKTRVPRGMGRSAGPSMAAGGRGQYASIVETIIDPDGTYNAGQNYNETFSLSLFPRAKSLAPQFQFYRAKMVTYTYEPLYNTFQQGSAGSKPYIYLQMNRTQLQFTNGLAELQASGARPKPFTSLTKVSYVPNWCSPGLVVQDGDNPAQGVAQLGLQKQYAWLATPQTDTGSADTANDIRDQAANTSNQYPTNNSVISNKVLYNGHVVHIDQQPVTTPPTPIGRLTIQVHWEFKGAHFSPQKGSVTSQ